MATVDMTRPVRADHRVIAKMLALSSKKVELHLDELEKVSRIFTKAGGSWERIFKGSSKDLDLLRKVLKVAASKGVLTKKENL